MSDGKRAAIRRATISGTIVTCESCQHQRVVNLPASKAVADLGWWRPTDDMIICDCCYILSAGV